MRLTMVGTGYVVLDTGSWFSQTGNNVSCLDVDESKVEMRDQGKSPVY